MIVLINGSFGVGKSTVADLLHTSIPGSVIYDPEWAGSILMRLPSWIKLKGSGTDDFQNIDLWRKSVVAGTRLFRRFAAGPVIVPMAFSHYGYFDEAVAGLRRLDDNLRVFCLRASLESIQKRLLERGTPIEGPGSEWVIRRSVECVAAHNDPHFGEPIDTENRPARMVANEILGRL